MSELAELRASFRAFLDREVAPHYDAWEAEGLVPREVFQRAAEHGFLAMNVPEAYGGAGVDDPRFSFAVQAEAMRAGFTSLALGFSLHTDICLPYVLELADDEQRARWLPGLADGSTIAAIAMTEPGAGSDLAAITTTARRDGDHYVLDGAKTFITNGVNADLVIVAAKTDPDRRGRGMSLLVVERGMEGFTRGRKLRKLGQHAQDTAELFFDGVRVPVENLLGQEGAGFSHLKTNLATERLSIASGALAAARGALERTVDHVRDRRAFGRTLAEFQHTRFVLAELDTELDIGQAYVDRCLEDLREGRLTGERAAKAKWWCTELQGRVVDRCLQLHGGYGYMAEYPISRDYADARISRIYGGTTEIMKELVARALLPR